MISFVLLHYKNIDDTIDCIKSIQRLKACKDISIIVVDNASGKCEDIQKIKKYTSDVVVLDENIGFANGNNIGCTYAIQKYKPDFLVVINNDTIIEQQDFIEKVYQSYQKHSFDVLGPKILTEDGDSVNPFPAYETIEEVKKALRKSQKLVKIYQNPFLRTLLQIYIGGKRIIRKPKHLQNGKTVEKDVSLHGCALIFSKKYYEKYKDIFYKGTFLYHEEEFLTYRRKRDHLIFLYDPMVSIFHKEGSSLNHNYKKKYYQKLIFREKNIQKSLSLLLEVMQKNEVI